MTEPYRLRVTHVFAAHPVRGEVLRMPRPTLDLLIERATFEVRRMLMVEVRQALDKGAILLRLFEQPERVHEGWQVAAEAILWAPTFMDSPYFEPTVGLLQRWMLSPLELASMGPTAMPSTGAYLRAKQEAARFIEERWAECRAECTLEDTND